MLLDARAQDRVCCSPRRVQALRLTNGHRLSSKMDDDALARRAVVPGQRHQILHRGLGRHAAVPHGDLRNLGQDHHQSKTTAYPSAGTAQTLGQDVLLEAVVLQQLVEQPTIFERAAAARLIEAVRHDQRVGIAELDANGEHHIAAQRAQRRHAQVAIDEHVATRAGGRRDHRHGALLTVGRKTGAHARGACRVANAQSGISKLKLAQLHLHRGEATEGRLLRLSRLARSEVELWRVCA